MKTKNFRELFGMPPKSYSKEEEYPQSIIDIPDGYHIILFTENLDYSKKRMDEILKAFTLKKVTCSIINILDRTWSKELSERGVQEDNLYYLYRDKLLCGSFRGCDMTLENTIKLIRDKGF